jgi:hypothetical protein
MMHMGSKYFTGHKFSGLKFADTTSPKEKVTEKLSVLL